MPPETVNDIAGRIERAADRYANAGDSKAAKAARKAAAQARMCKSVAEAAEVERRFNASRGIGPSGQTHGTGTVYHTGGGSRPAGAKSGAATDSSDSAGRHEAADLGGGGEFGAAGYDKGGGGDFDAPQYDKGGGGDFGRQTDDS